MAKSPSFGVRLLGAKSDSNMFLLCLGQVTLSLWVSGSLGLHVRNEPKNQDCVGLNLHLLVRAYASSPNSAFGDLTWLA